MDAEGLIDRWACSSCGWTKLPENRHTGPTENTLRIFDAHSCADYPDKLQR